MTNFEEQIKLLIELQGLDSQIFKLEDELTSIPEKINMLESQFKDKTAHLKHLEDGVKALQLKRKEREGELESKEGSIKKFQSQMYQVKTNKEYTALQGEIGRVKADNSLIEEEIIKIFDAIDIENKKIVTEKDNLKQQEASLDQEKKKMNDDAGRIKTELESLKLQRSVLASKVDTEILKKYDRIIKKGDGLAVVAVNGESCQGCFTIMPPQVLNEIKINNRIILCENCARILYIAE